MPDEYYYPCKHLSRIVVENFDIVHYVDDSHLERIDIYLDEIKDIPEELSNKTVISHGFTQEKIIQDFPIRGKSVYLHLRRRKWLDTTTKEIYTRKYDLSFEGTQLTKEFVSFLKEANR